MVVAFRMYGNDFNYLAVTPGNEFFWYKPLGPYGITPGVMLCPAAASTNVTPLTIPFSPGTADRAWFTFSGVGSYGFNTHFVVNTTLTNMLQSKNDFWNKIPLQPSATPVFADSINPASGPIPASLPATNLYTGEGTELQGMCPFDIARHGSQSAAAAPRIVDTSQPLSGKTDVALYDGHVESSRLEDLWNYYWTANWVIPNPRPGR